MEEKNEVKNNKNRKNKIIIVSMLFVVIVIASVSFMFYKINMDKYYQIEEIKEFSYFKLYENEKYGVIDSKRKYFDRSKI